MKKKIKINGNLRDINFPSFADFVDEKRLEILKIRFGKGLYLYLYIKINLSYSMIGIWFKYQKFNKVSISEDEFIIESFDFTQKGYQEMIDYVNSKEFKAFIYSLGVGD